MYPMAMGEAPVCPSIFGGAGTDGKMRPAPKRLAGTGLSALFCQCPSSEKSYVTGQPPLPDAQRHHVPRGVKWVERKWISAVSGGCQQRQQTRTRHGDLRGLVGEDPPYIPGASTACQWSWSIDPGAEQWASSPGAPINLIQPCPSPRCPVPGLRARFHGSECCKGGAITGQP